MNRAEAEKLVKERVKGDFLINHMISTEAIMKAAARYLKEDEELWALTGLLHDVDYELTKDNPVEHGVVAQDILRGKAPDEVLHAIMSHNYMNPDAPARQSRMEHILVAADSMTGLIIACAMVKEKKISNVTDDTVKKAFKKKGFAAGSKREMIMECETAGIPYDAFVGISVKAMKEIAGEIGL
ncbi:MAG: HD domain-containing protein [archaeon]